MSELITYFQLGIGHILDVDALDHLLFLSVLCGSFQLPGWKNLIGLISGFTLGHAASMILVLVMNIALNTDLIELLIAMTIMAGAAMNLFSRTTEPVWYMKIGIISIFGFIHGCGFSSTIKPMFLNVSDVIRPLIGFNLGVEVAQVLVVGIIYLFLYFCIRWKKAWFISVVWVINILVLFTSCYWIYLRILRL